MKSKKTSLLYWLLILLLFSLQANAQFSTLNYVSHGYFDGLSFNDSLLIEESFVITITEKKVEILKIDANDLSKDSLFLERRCLSALKYPTGDGEYYYVWKLGDRKMVLRNENGAKYLSLYQTNAFGLPNEYLTFKIQE